MSDRLKTERQITKTTTFRRGGYVGEIVQRPGARPLVNIARRNTDGRLLGNILSETMDPVDLEIVASILTGMHTELTAGVPDYEGPISE
jgi:hypothetical protein